eukprot:scaffold231538_cov39-Prasinocladus_malaysianus.AAC.1
MPLFLVRVLEWHAGVRRARAPGLGRLQESGRQVRVLALVATGILRAADAFSVTLIYDLPNRRFWRYGFRPLGCKTAEVGSVRRQRFFNQMEPASHHSRKSSWIFAATLAMFTLSFHAVHADQLLNVSLCHGTYLYYDTPLEGGGKSAYTPLRVRNAAAVLLAAKHINSLNCTFLEPGCERLVTWQGG